MYTTRSPARGVLPDEKARSRNVVGRNCDTPLLEMFALTYAPVPPVLPPAESVATTVEVDPTVEVEPTVEAHGPAVVDELDGGSVERGCGERVSSSRRPTMSVVETPSVRFTILIRPTAFASAYASVPSALIEMSSVDRSADAVG